MPLPIGIFTLNTLIMKNTLSTLSRNQSLLYKVFLFIAATFLILYLFPKAGQFKYDFQKGKPWQYENLYAPFSFTIKKDASSLEIEKQQIVDNAEPYFDIDFAAVESVKIEFYRLLDEAYQNSLFRESKLSLQSKGATIIDEIYKHGVVSELYSYDADKLVYLKNGNEIDKVTFHQIVNFDAVSSIVEDATSLETISPSIDLLEKILTIVIKPNVSLNTKLTQAAIDDEINATLIGFRGLRCFFFGFSNSFLTSSTGSGSSMSTTSDSSMSGVCSMMSI